MEYSGVMHELIQGMEKAKQLRFHLCLTSTSDPRTLLLLQRVLSSFDKALMLLKWKNSPPVLNPPPQSSSVSPERDNDRNHDHPASSKKRKLQPTWTEQVRVNSDNGLDGPTDDGYSWRKYGQKDILSAKFPRSYYRCTYRAVQDCWATKQVQRSDDDPTVFEVTYRGAHTCSHLSNEFILPATSPEKQQSGNQNDPLVNLKANLRVSTDNLDQNEIETMFTFPSTMNAIDNHGYFPVDVNDHQLGMYLNSPLFLSPATAESNYFSPITYQMRNFPGMTHCQYSECDAPEIVSTHASTTNSPIRGIEFPIELDSTFLFNNEYKF